MKQEFIALRPSALLCIFTSGWIAGQIAMAEFRLPGSAVGLLLIGALLLLVREDARESIGSGVYRRGSLLWRRGDA